MLHRSRLALRITGARRSTLLWTALAAVAALASGSRVAASLADASAAAGRYGDVVDVVVAARPIEPGRVLEPADVERRSMPSAFVPEGEVAGARVTGLVALGPIARGEVLLRTRLSASLVPAGWRALAIAPAGMGSHPAVGPGDLVEVLDVGGDTGSSVPIEGIVVDLVDDGSLTVAVRGEDAARVAYAASAGTAVVALIAPAPRR